MPKKLERKLKKQARSKFPGNEERQDKYIYGTLRKTGWKPSQEKMKTGKGNPHFNESMDYRGPGYMSPEPVDRGHTSTIRRVE